MRRQLTLLILLVCAPLVYAAQATAHLYTTDLRGLPIAIIDLVEVESGLNIAGTFAGLPPGTHAFHIHEYGLCSNQGRDAGGHYNPDGSPHGHIIKDGFAGAHPGDLGNIIIDDMGNADIDITVPNLRISQGDYTVAGRAFIIHELADDFGQPTGNAGGRLGCGVITIKG